MRTGRKRNTIWSFLPWNFSIQDEYISSFSHVVRAVCRILASVSFSFEVFDVCKKTGRSFSSGFSFLISLILLHALTWVLNNSIFGEKQPGLTAGSSHIEKKSFLEPANCYLDSTLSFCRRPSIPTDARPATLCLTVSTADRISVQKETFIYLQSLLPTLYHRPGSRTLEALTRKASNLLGPAISLLLQSALRLAFLPFLITAPVTQPLAG